MYYDQKTLKKIQNKRKAKGRKIWGWVLLILGGVELFSLISDFSLTNIAYGIVFMAVGALLLLSAKKDVEKWDKYTAVINPNGNTSIKAIASKVGVSETRAKTEIQRMISNKFFVEPLSNRDAFIDEKYNFVVMASGGIAVEPINQEDIEKANAEAAEEILFDEAEEKKTGYSFSDKIRAAINQTDDTDVIEYLCSIDSSVRKIDKCIQEKPELDNVESVVKLKSTYLPQTMELIQKYCSGEASAEVMFEIKGMLKTCSEVFNQIERKLYEKEDIDTLIDIEVMKQTFEREGLMASDFEIKLH